jgi:hypothetical protein
MSHRNPKPRDFVGKTIKRIDTRAVNVWRFFFTDGTAIAIEVEAVGLGLSGMVVCDACVSGVDDGHDRAVDRSDLREGGGEVPQEGHSST